MQSNGLVTKSSFLPSDQITSQRQSTGHSGNLRANRKAMLPFLTMFSSQRCITTIENQSCFQETLGMESFL